MCSAPDRRHTVIRTAVGIAVAVLLSLATARVLPIPPAARLRWRRVTVLLAGTAWYIALVRQVWS